VEGQGVRQVRKWRTIWESMSFKGFWFVLGLLFGTFLLFHTQVNLRCKSSAVRFIRESDSLPIEFATTVGKYEQGSARAATLSLNWWVWIFVASPAHRTALDSHTATHTPTAGGKANCYKEITAAAYKRKPQPVHLAVCVYARLRTLCVCVRVCEGGRKCLRVCSVYVHLLPLAKAFFVSHLLSGVGMQMPCGTYQDETIPITTWSSHVWCPSMPSFRICVPCRMIESFHGCRSVHTILLTTKFDLQLMSL